MKNYKFTITYKGRTLARSSSKTLAEKRFIELKNYLSNPAIIVNGFGIKDFDANELKLNSNC